MAKVFSLGLDGRLTSPEWLKKHKQNGKKTKWPVFPPLSGEDPPAVEQPPATSRFRWKVPPASEEREEATKKAPVSSAQKAPDLEKAWVSFFLHLNHLNLYNYGNHRKNI